VIRRTITIQSALICAFCSSLGHRQATAIEVPSSHVAMLSFPKEVAELIIKAAE
jgi:hypothetical protein